MVSCFVTPYRSRARAVAYHIASSEAVDLLKSDSHLWCPAMLQRGVAATLGPTFEPYLVAFPLPDDFFSLLLTGRAPLAEGLSALDLMRQSLDRVLEGMPAYGMPNYVLFDGDYRAPWFREASADTYPSILIAAWDYFDGTHDKVWLAKNYAGIRQWAEQMLATDRNGNGLIQYVESGNSGSWPARLTHRPSNWWDAIGFGQEDAYANALACRALGGMERLAAKLDKTADAARYRAAAGKLRAAYLRTFFNRKDYVDLQHRWGAGQKEDGSDGFQIYQNGGASACFAYFTLAALYDLGRREEADRILFPMLDALEKGKFQGFGPNGMTNDWKAWDGTPWGYEGFLVDNYYVLLAVLAREGLLEKQ